MVITTTPHFLKDIIWTHVIIAKITVCSFDFQIRQSYTWKRIFDGINIGPIKQLPHQATTGTEYHFRENVKFWLLFLYVTLKTKCKEKKDRGNMLDIGNKTHVVIEWVSDCCLTPIQQFSSYISWREQVNFQWDDDEVRFVLD